MKFRRRLELQSNLNLVPMVDVVFQLVLFFLVSTTFVLAPGIKLTLPASGTAESVVMEQMVVTIVSKGEVYLNKERFESLGELGERVAQMPESERKQVDAVIIEADQDVPYGLMVQGLDVLRQNGFKNVGLRTRDVAP
ncbi:MAG: biopolymer transporter ExbD [Acidobacteria bacterium]|jgi:biopolymer transport protein ExbD|nr:biopolymer transporter ExbD [Acidobacteriota bacterium]